MRLTLPFRIVSILFSVLFLLILISSCTKKITSTSKKSEIETIRMMPVGFPPSELSYDVTIECDKTTNAPKPLKKIFKSDKKTTTATINGNNLNITHTTDTIFIEVPCIDKKITDESNVEKVREVWPWWIIYVIGYSALVTILFVRKIFT